MCFLHKSKKFARWWEWTLKLERLLLIWAWLNIIQMLRGLTVFQEKWPNMCDHLWCADLEIYSIPLRLIPCLLWCLSVIYVLSCSVLLCSKSLEKSSLTSVQCKEWIRRNSRNQLRNCSLCSFRLKSVRLLWCSSIWRRNSIRLRNLSRVLIILPAC